jgi:hypothetical protein
MDMFQTGPIAYNHLLRNFDDRTMVWSILRFTNVPNSVLCAQKRQALLQKIYNYGVDDMFKCAADTNAAAAAIVDWTYLRRSGEQRQKVTPDSKMVVDYVTQYSIMEI